MKKKSYADMDPLEEIRAIKEETSRRFKTATAYGQYLRKKYPNGMNPEKFVRPEEIVFTPSEPKPLFDEKEAYTPPVYHPDMDPLEEIRAIKIEIYQKFKTVDAYFKYLEEKYPNDANPENFVRPEDVASYFVQSDAKTEKTASNRTKRRKSVSAAKPRRRGKLAKRLVPA